MSAADTAMVLAITHELGGFKPMTTVQLSTIPPGGSPPTRPRPTRCSEPLLPQGPADADWDALFADDGAHGTSERYD